MQINISSEISIPVEFPEICLIFPNFSRYFHTICTGLGAHKVTYDIVQSKKSVDVKLTWWIYTSEASLLRAAYLAKNVHALTLLFLLFNFSFNALGYIRCLITYFSHKIGECSWDLMNGCLYLCRCCQFSLLYGDKFCVEVKLVVKTISRKSTPLWSSQNDNLNELESSI